MGALWVILLAVLCGCSLFSSPTPGYCIGQQAGCPAGQACSATTGLCEQAVDMAQVPDIAAPVDMARQQRQPDLAPDMAQQNMTGCASGKGAKVSKGSQDVWACPGTFSSQAQKTLLCGLGYGVCTTGIEVDESACSSAGGFFLVDYPFSDNVVQTVTTYDCGSEGGNIKALLGCGISGTVRPISSPCQGLSGQSVCPMQAGHIVGWSCVTGYQDASNTNSDDGVLCCKM